MSGSRHPGAVTSDDDRLELPLDTLRAALLPTVEFLGRRRADLIDTVLIDAYIALHWMEWHGGSLRLTVTGRNVCAQLSHRSK